MGQGILLPSEHWPYLQTFVVSQLEASLVSMLPTSNKGQDAAKQPTMLRTVLPQTKMYKNPQSSHVEIKHELATLALSGTYLATQIQWPGPDLLNQALWAWRPALL